MNWLQVIAIILPIATSAWAAWPSETGYTMKYGTVVLQPFFRNAPILQQLTRK